MTLASMTGFARTEGSHGTTRWAWELRSVNGKGLDLRIRLANGFERLEPQLREMVRKMFARGSVSANLTVTTDRPAQMPRINEEACLALYEQASKLAERAGSPAPEFSTILGLKGVVDFADSEDEADREVLEAAMAADFVRCLESLRDARFSEGKAVSDVIHGHIDTIARLTDEAENNPARSAEAIRARLADLLETITSANADIDPQRLHQEAAMLATKADIREELDRLHAHVEAARALLAGGGPVGRKLDFLAQEFNRETNTLCSKSNDVTLTRTGLDLKAVVDQMREQIQNLE
ncbi:MAG: YicC family protein [Hyphomicrobiales bacterium]|nr:MAG: YicC family protein [Hyphomicrobiales bacterium]